MSLNARNYRTWQANRSSTLVPPTWYVFPDICIVYVQCTVYICLVANTLNLAQHKSAVLLLLRAQIVLHGIAHTDKSAKAATTILDYQYTTNWVLDGARCREVCRDPDNFNWLASLLVEHLNHETWVRISGGTELGKLKVEDTGVRSTQ